MSMNFVCVCVATLKLHLIVLAYPSISLVMYSAMLGFSWAEGLVTI